MLGLQVRDLTGGFKCFRREVLEAIDLPTVRSQGYAFQVELTYRAVRARLPRASRCRSSSATALRGQSKMSWRIAAEAMWLVPQLRRATLSPGRAQAARRAAPMRTRMDANQLALVQGMRDTRATLVRWNAAPWSVAAAWLLGAAAIAAGLLAAVLVDRLVATPDADADPAARPERAADLGAVGPRARTATRSCWRCTRWPASPASSPARSRAAPGPAPHRLHEEAARPAGPLAIAFVVCATSFSLATQAYVLGNAASTLAAQGHMPVALLLVGILPHAIPELIALFLPLAAWIIASRRGEWHELLAATFVTVGHRRAGARRSRRSSRCTCRRT